MHAATHLFCGWVVLCVALLLALERQGVIAVCDHAHALVSVCAHVNL
jgi:hypothetical protein